MSNPLPALRALLQETGAYPAPQPLPLPLLAGPAGELRPADQGSVETVPRPFSFFLASAAECWLLGEVAGPDGTPLPITGMSLAAGVVSRSESRLQPFLQPVHGLVVVLPEALAGQIQADRYRAAGLTPVIAGSGGSAREELLWQQQQALAQLVEETKEAVFLSWHEAAGVAGHQILIEGSLLPTENALSRGSWTGIRPVTHLSPLEEQAALTLPAQAASVPFGFGVTGGYWYTRLTATSRPASAEGLLRLETAFVNDEQVASKVTALTRAVIHERFPVTAAEPGHVALYPLHRARVWLQTLLTTSEAVLQAL